MILDYVRDVIYLKAKRFTRLNENPNMDIFIVTKSSNDFCIDLALAFPFCFRHISFTEFYSKLITTDCYRSIHSYSNYSLYTSVLLDYIRKFTIVNFLVSIFIYMKFPLYITSIIDEGD